MAFVTLEDFTGKGDLIFFADAFSKFQNILYVDSMILVSGKAESNGDSVRMMAADAMLLEEAGAKLTRSIAISIDGTDQSKELLVSLKKMVGISPIGNCSIFFSVSNSNEKPKILKTNMAVNPNRQFMDHLTDLFGKENVRLIA